MKVVDRAEAVIPVFLVAAVLATAPLVTAREIRLTANLDESQVVRPVEFRPPAFGTGSPGTGWASIALDTETAAFAFEMEITGIDPEILDSSVGPNRTAIHVHAGPSHERGPFTIDVHHFARQALPDSNGLTPIEGGFRLEASGEITQLQGELDTTFTPERIIEFLRTGESFIAVHTSSNDLFRTGAIRGNFSVLPEVLRLRAALDESRVVRPEAFQPPVFGTGSPGTAVAFLSVNTVTGAFTFDFEVEGIPPEIVDNTVGDNFTGIHVHRAIHVHGGPPPSTGPFLIDVHHLGRENFPRTNGLEPTANGFRLHVESEITRVQGALDTTFSPAEIIEFLRNEEGFITVHTNTNELFRAGAIRGMLSVLPDEIRLRAAVDESHAVRPPMFQPPLFGTGSPGTGTAHLVVNAITGAYTFDLDIAGIDPAILEGTIGANGTGIHVHQGKPDARGPFIIDVHHHAREILPETNGVTPTDSGFRLYAEGHVTSVQGALETGFSMDEIIGFLSQEDETFVAVHTTANELFRTGAIRGNFEHFPAVRFVRGDCNGDRRTDIADAVVSLDYLFGGGAAPGCLEACNVNDDTEYNIADPITILRYLFEGGVSVPAPFPLCDIDPDWRRSVGCGAGICE